MRFSQSGAIAFAFSVVLAGCSDTGSTRVQPADARQAFKDGSWTLSVDRAFRVGTEPVASASSPLPETGYSPTSAVHSYLFVVTDHAARLQVHRPNMVALLVQSSAEQLTYNVTEGAFAGGRIVVWRGANNVLQGELTTYGSGVPIVQSERGAVRMIVELAN